MKAKGMVMLGMVVVSLCFSAVVFAQTISNTGTVQQIGGSYCLVGTDGSVLCQLNGADIARYSGKKVTVVNGEVQGSVISLDDADKDSILGEVMKGARLDVLRLLANRAREANVTSVAITDEENNRIFTFDFNPGFDLPATITITTYTYDGEGNLILQESDIKVYDATGTVINEGKNTITYMYNGDGRLISKNETDVMGGAIVKEANESYVYSDEGTLISSNKTVVEYDAEGNLVSSSSEERIYDSAGRILSEEVINETQYSKNTATTTYEYDENGRLTLRASVSISESYWDNVNSYSYEWKTTETFAYDEAGHVISKETVSTYTGYRNGEVYYTYKERRTDGFAYDSEGRIIKETHSWETDWGKSDSVITYTYDAKGRLIEKRETGSYIYYRVDPFWESVLKNVYNTFDKLAKTTSTYRLWSDEAHTDLMTSQDEVTTYSYDRRGNLISENTSRNYRQYSHGAITYSWDTYLSKLYSKGKLIQETERQFINGKLSSTRSVTNTYNPSGTLIATLETYNSYDADGQVYYSRSRTSSYNRRGDIVSVVEKTYSYGRMASLHKEQYTYDANGTLRKKTIDEKGYGWKYNPDTQQDEWGERSSFKGEYTYDEKGRILSEYEDRIGWQWGYIIPCETGAVKAGESIMQIWPPRYPWWGPYRSTSLTNYGYDKNGTLAQKTVSRQSYDEKGNLTGSFTAEYAYNSDGKLVYQHEKNVEDRGFIIWWDRPILYETTDAIINSGSVEAIELKPEKMEPGDLPIFSTWGNYELTIKNQYDDNGNLLSTIATYQRSDYKDGTITSYFYGELRYKDGKLIDKKIEEYGQKYWWWTYPYLEKIICYDTAELKTDTQYNELVSRMSVEEAVTLQANDRRFCSQLATDSENLALQNQQ